MSGKYYARFEVKHVDQSDSYLRKAYTNLDLHTDGTYVKEKTDWLIMTKMEEQNVSGGESVILHLDDWEYLEDLSKPWKMCLSYFLVDQSFALSNIFFKKNQYK